MTDEFTAGQRLKALRNRAGLSIREMAEKLGKKTSSYQYYEDDYTRAYLPLELTKALVGIFEPYGIKKSQVLQLSGLTVTTGEGETEHREALSGDNFLTTKSDANAAIIDELDVRAAAGAGQIHDSEGKVAEWVLPKALVKFATNALPEYIKILTIVGDSMPNTFRPFDKVMVDISDRTPSPPGIFAVWDGLGLVVKRVEHVAFSDPSTVRLISENPAYQTYERTLEEAHIQGRVLGKWQWV